MQNDANSRIEHDASDVGMTQMTLPMTRNPALFPEKWRRWRRWRDSGGTFGDAKRNNGFRAPIFLQNWLDVLAKVR